MKKILIAIICPLIMIACGQEEENNYASGSFEATEIIISSEANGVIKELNIEEGQTIEEGAVVGFIDSTNLTLMKKQVKAQSAAISSRKPDINSQLATLRTQIAYAEQDRERVKKLVAADAATQKQLDDIENQIKVLNNQIEAQKTALELSSSSISRETVPLKIQMNQLSEQISKYTIINPLNGTILIKYAEAMEITTVGKPLYKIADLSNMTLKAYLTGEQLAKVKIGQKVKVRIDVSENEYKDFNGEIEKIANKAEFTPKTIQTKNERQNLVYEIKVKVKNDGYLKIGMYGEVLIP